MGFCLNMGIGRKSTDIQVEERIIFILDLMSKGIKSFSDLFRFFSDEYPDLTERQFQYDLQKAKDRIKEHLTEDVELLTSDLLRHLWELYNKAHKEKDFRECRNIIKQIAELTGANAAMKVEHSGTVSIVEQLKNTKFVDAAKLREKTKDA